MTTSRKSFLTKDPFFEPEKHSPRNMGGSVRFLDKKKATPFPVQPLLELLFRCYFTNSNQVYGINELSMLCSRNEADLPIRFTPLVGADTDSDFLIKPFEKIEQFIRGEAAKVSIH